MDKKYTRQIWHGEGHPNKVVRDDDDSDTTEPVEHDGIGELLDDLHQGVFSNVRVSTSTSEGNSDHEHNIQFKVEGTSEQFVKLVRNA